MSKSIAPKLARIGSADPGLTTVLEYIGPDLARAYLVMSILNRKLRQSWVIALARMMTAGDWKLTHQGISFDVNGRLRDGQHRLHAIIKSGVTVPMMVTRGLSPDVMDIIDTHARRSDADAAQLQGLEVGTQAIAIAKRMHDSVHAYEKNRCMTRPEVLRFVERHMDAIRFAMRGSHGKYLGHSSVRAPIGRAYYTADRDRLNQFLDCLLTAQMQSPSDLAAITFLRMLYRDRKEINAGCVARARLYRKAENALLNFLNGKPIKIIRELTDEEFPLPEETEG